MSITSPRLRLLAAVWLVQLGACTGDLAGENPSAGGSNASAGSSGAAAAGGTATEPGLGAAELPNPLVRRLTRDELANSLADSVGIALSAEELAPIPQDRPLEGFVNIATSQTASVEHVAGYAKVARAVAQRLDTAFIDARASCQTSAPECGASLVSNVGKLLFRRPVAAEELAAFVGLFGKAVAEGITFGEAARVVVEAMLQSPQFLYRLEHETAVSLGLAPGQLRSVGGYEMATRLSYLLWQSAPDAALLQAAEAGALDHGEGIQQEVARMLQQREWARRATDRFLLDWARLESLPNTELKPALVSSLLAFFEHMVWDEPTPLLDLLTVRRAFLTASLAERYGLTPAGEGVAEYDTSAAPGRMGLLTQPGFIAGMTNADGGAIVARGLFLQSQLFCGDTPSPPPSFADAIANFVASQPPDISLRQLADLRSARPECGGCHATFDPLAYGLEQFDYQGAFRTVDDFGNPLTTDGWIPGRFDDSGEDTHYMGVEDYMPLLAASPAVGACLTKQQLQFAIGQKLGHEQDAVAADLFKSVAAQGGTYVAMLTAITQHALFQKMKVE